MESKICLICECKEHILLWPCYDRLIGVSGNFSIVRCLNCNFLFLNPRPDENEIAKYYPSNYYSFYKWAEKTDFLSIVYRKVKWKYLSFWDITRPPGVPKFKKNGKILDFGCGSGEVLHILRNLGWDVYGVEADKKAVKYAQSKGLMVSSDNLTSLNFASNSFDVIRLRSVLEHLHEPAIVLKEIRRILKPEGILCLIVPNIESFTAKLFKSRWYNLDTPRHLYHFSFHSLHALLDGYGFHITSKRTCSNSGFLGSLDNLINEKKNQFGNRLLQVKLLRLLFFIILDFWLNIFKKGDLIEIQAKKIID